MNLHHKAGEWLLMTNLRFHCYIYSGCKGGKEIREGLDLLSSRNRRGESGASVLGTGEAGQELLYDWLGIHLVCMD
jgi:hypothetical protein